MKNYRTLHKGLRAMFWAEIGGMIGSFLFAIVLVAVLMLSAVRDDGRIQNRVYDLIEVALTVSVCWSGLLVLTGAGIRFALCREEKRYGVSGILQLLMGAFSIAFAFGGMNFYMELTGAGTLVLEFIASAVSLLYLCMEIAAHRRVLAGVDDSLAKKWRVLRILLLCGPVAVVLLMALMALAMQNANPMLAVAAVPLFLLLPAGMIVLYVLRYVYLYKTGSRFKAAAQVPGTEENALRNELWNVTADGDLLLSVSSPDDLCAMNWVEGEDAWGRVTLPDRVECRVERAFDGEALKERYTFTNTSDHDVFAPAGSIAINTPFNDSYHEAETCLTRRCHTHISCCGNGSWIMALRMGGAAPHLGLVLTEGSLDSYSVKRATEGWNIVSNNRGDFLLHPEALHLLPGESYSIEWKLFWHEGREDFFRKAQALSPCMKHITADKFIAFRGEEVTVTDGEKSVSVDTDRPGEAVLDFGGTKANVLVLPELEQLLKNRAHFIAEKQQYRNPASMLDGAYLAYDNETGSPVYSRTHDHNGARERVCMGALMALYARETGDRTARDSVERYAAYVLRELYDGKTGHVYNDAGHDPFVRLYNAPWMSVFFLEMYDLTSDRAWLLRCADATRAYYREGGENFYAICIPMTDLTEKLTQAGETALAEEMCGLFVAHARRIAEIGLNYPKSEVDYEQSIVAPAVDDLLMGYDLCRDEALLAEAERQLGVLDLFSGVQPDYHMYEVAVRHWDGYWFGKRRMLGDTFPHYWSALTGRVFARYARITGKEAYAKRAENALRGPLSMIFPDGSASCAMVYPRTVNGEAANFYDPWANDQDWGLYFYAKYRLTGRI